jgi:tyrosyl-tRNA synthetase
MNKRIFNFAQHLASRGVLQSSTLHHTEPNILSSAKIDYSCAAYCGFDPTAKYLHLGNYIQIVTLARASLFEIQPIYLMGGATGMIGDPSGKLSSRAQLSLGEVDSNADRITSDLRILLTNLFSYIQKTNLKTEQDYLLLNNKEFYEDLNMIDFLVKYGSHLNMASLLRREVVAKRLENEHSMSFSEFSYQIFQAIDYLTLYQRYVW